MTIYRCYDCGRNWPTPTCGCTREPSLSRWWRQVKRYWRGW